MRFFLAVVSVALIAAAVSCSDTSEPGGSSGAALHSIAVEICRELRAEYSLSDKGAAQDFLFITGWNGAQKVVDSAAPGHIVGLQEYSDALDSVCPQTVRSFLGGHSLYGWEYDLTD
jgi:hypothetical protein